jgi:hypothetical protein
MNVKNSPEALQQAIDAIQAFVTQQEEISTTLRNSVAQVGADWQDTKYQGLVSETELINQRMESTSEALQSAIPALNVLRTQLEQYIARNFPNA